MLQTKTKRKTGSTIEKERNKGCFSNQNVRNKNKTFKERKTEVFNWRDSENGFIKTGDTWKPRRRGK